MSEANILNPSASSLLNPDYAYSEGLPETRQLVQMQSGKEHARENMLRGRVFDLGWNRVQLATRHTLEQFWHQYKLDFFTFVDWERTRYYSGRFAGPPVFSPIGNDAWSVRAQFKELPGLALNTYPSDWSRDATFLEERDGFGNDLVKQTGTWTYATTANAHGGAHMTYPNTDTTGKAEWIYFGYACRLWNVRANDFGRYNARVIRVRDGVTVNGPVQVDLWSFGGGTLPSSAMYAPGVSFFPLDLYRVSIEATNTQNGGSSGKTITADALEVMR